jgi:hypothetical protein
MNKVNYFITILLTVFMHSQAFASEELSVMKPDPRDRNTIAEIWCVLGYKVLYVEKTTNETFQFFQVTHNSGIAVKGMECDGTEVRVVE